MKKENQFQSELITELKGMFPDAIVIKTDPTYIQGFPDLLILHKNRWACLECKRSAASPHRPNQDYYVDKLNAMSYSAFICPENRRSILYDLQQAFND